MEKTETLWHAVCRAEVSYEKKAGEGGPVLIPDRTGFMLNHFLVLLSKMKQVQ